MIITTYSPLVTIAMSLFFGGLGILIWIGLIGMFWAMVAYIINIFKAGIEHMKEGKPEKEVPEESVQE